MRPYLKFLLLFLILTNLGCSKVTRHSPPPTLPPGKANDSHTDEQPSALDLNKTWKVRYFSKCEAGTPENCQGSYGFVFHSDGTFELGPDPTGQTLRGSISAKELQDLHPYLGKITANTRFASTGPTCLRGIHSEPDQLIEISQGDSIVSLIHSSKDEFCFNSLAPENARTLEASVVKVISKYHPQPFPGPCPNAAVSLDKLHDSMRSCNYDTDCAYIDENLSPLQSESVATLDAGDCGYIKPILVANSFSVVSNQLRLLQENELVRTSCSQEMARVTCGRHSVYRIDRRPPVCVKNLCQMNPEITKE